LERSREKLREALAEMLQDSFTDVVPTRPTTRIAPPSRERLFSDGEVVLLDRDARGYLLSLVSAGQITRLQMELIVNYVSFFWSAPVGVGDLEDLLDQVVFGMEPADPDMPDPWSGPSLH